MPESRFSLIILALLLIACGCIYGTIVVPGSTFAGMDFLNLNYPRVWLIREALKSGHLPLWNWYEWGGAPLLAALQGAVFYPPTWLAMAFPLPYGLQLFVFLHLYLAGLGAYFLGRTVAGLDRTCAALVAIAYMGSGFFPGRVEQFQIVAVNCLLPWLILAMRSVIRGKGNPAWFALLWAGHILAGHPQYAVLNLLGAGLFLLVLEGRSLVQWRVLARLAGAFIMGTGLSMVQILPTWELSQLSERIWPYGDPTTPELVWHHLPALVVPYYYEWLTGETGRILGFTELGLYCGILTIPLALCGIWMARRKSGDNRRLVLACGIVWLVAMVFALGKNAGLATLVFDYAPFFKQTRGAARSLNIASLMLCLMAGIGLFRVLQALRNRAGGWTEQLPPARLAIMLCLFMCADLALNHYKSIASVMVPAETLAAQPLADDRAAPYPGTLYRFMSHDSDLFLNNSAAAVRERKIRTQPNFGSLDGVALLDGYEEGLLPTRNHANAHRLYNRNLRNDAPDVALLAFMRATTMLTEFPLPEQNNGWVPNSSVVSRPAIVPGVFPGEPAAYRLWKSPYQPTVALDFDRLFDTADQPRFLKSVSAGFPLNTRHRVSPQQSWTRHPLETITAERFNEAVIATEEDVSSVRFAWNHLHLPVNDGTTQALVLIPPYPGWKVDDDGGVLKSDNSLFFLLDLPDRLQNEYDLNLVYRPFSLRFGLFVSLISLLLIIVMMIEPRTTRA